MTTALVSKCNDIGLTGSPHIPGDMVVIEWEGAWIDALVIDVSASLRNVFGLRWALEVEPLPLGEGTTVVYCDDNGRNHTRGRGVRASQLLGE